MKKKQIEQILKDYSWMMNSIRIMRESLMGAGEGLTAQYGDEAAMPKAKGTTGDPVYREIIRREKRYRVIDKYESKISVIQDRIHLIKDDREIEVLHWLLEGKSYAWIARHMGLSDRHVRRIRDSIVDKMSDMSSLPKTS
jgi:hypothetical protein